jgi:hypothetical protein
MFKKNKISILALCVTALFSQLAFSDTIGNQSPGGTLTGGVDVTRGVVQQLEDELSKHMSQTKFDAKDYKAWNTAFRAKLNDGMVKFEGRIETDIVQKLKPLVDQYQEILQDPGIRPDQANSLKAVQIAKLRDRANALAPQYRAIYVDLLKDVMGWLPVVNTQFIEEKENLHALENTTEVIANIVTLNIAFNDSAGDEPTRREATYGFSVNSLDGTAAPVDGKLKLNYLGLAEDKTTFLIGGLDNNLHSLSGPQVSGLPTAPVNGDGSYADAADFVTAMTDSINQYQNSLLAVDALESQPGTSAVWAHYFAPNVKQDCQSQVCLALKESDLLLTLETVSNQIDVPFTINFSDGAQVTVSNPSVAVNAYEGYLNIAVTDNNLPFDTNDGN